MSLRQSKKLYVAAIIERYDNHLLIVLPQDETDRRLWQFPRGPAGSGETPEAAMRRIVHDDLGLTVEVVVGQPPLVERIDDTEVELRYFFCGIINGDVESTAYAEYRWVPKHHLNEYELDGPSRPVAQWLLESR